VELKRKDISKDDTMIKAGELVKDILVLSLMPMVIVSTDTFSALITYRSISQNWIHLRELTMLG